MLNKTLVILFFTALTVSNFNASAQKTTIWLVRHAEKLTLNTNNKDPGLSEAGIKRATDLALKLQKEKIVTIYSTNYTRTTATVTPLAATLHLTPVIYEAKNPDLIADKALTNNKGKAALIVGHSNTLVPLLKALRCAIPFDELSDDDYDMLFKVTVNNKEKAQLTISRYGDVHHTTNLTKGRKNVLMLN